MLTLAAAAAALLVGASGAPLAESDYMSRFNDYMTAYNKIYTHEQFRERYAIFKSNVDFVENFHGSHKVAINEFADLSPKEFAATYNGFANDRKTSKNVAPFAGDVSQLPAEVDWRQKGAVTGVKNQGQCGSCWSFSATGSMEGQHFLSKQGALVGLSEQNLVDCSTDQGNQGCNGGLMDDAFQYVITNNGIDSEASYPYTATGPNNCQFQASNVATTINSYTDITTGSESALQQAAATVGPISVAIDASQQSFQFYSGGVYNEPACSSTQLDHGVLVVGYGTSMGTDYWLVKNSWGASWGLQGYIMMSRNLNNQCGIATSASYPVISSSPAVEAPVKTVE